MYKRLPSLALCLAAAVLGTSACGASGESRSSASAAPAAASSAPAAAPSEQSAATGPAEARTLTALSSMLYLRTVRKNYPDLERIDDDALVEHGNALCTTRGAALGDQFKKTVKELDITPKQASGIMGAAHAFCR
ncbi:hypothetical protein [Streptomyces sp. NPDC002537]